MFTGVTQGLRQEAIRKFALPGSTILALLLGTAVYILDRDWTTTLLLAPVASFQPETNNVFGELGHVLPSFLHAYAFSLLIILALGRTRHARRIGAVGWFMCAAVLEVLQADLFRPLFIDSTTHSAAQTMTNSFQAYFVNGHFDPSDIAATALGCIAAFVIASVLEVAK